MKSILNLEQRIYYNENCIYGASLRFYIARLHLQRELQAQIDVYKLFIFRNINKVIIKFAKNKVRK
jgi:hypothetical protein